MAKPTKIDYKPLFETYANGELTATQIANTYGINRSSFLQCYKRFCAKFTPQINTKKLHALDMNQDELKATAYEIAYKALAKIDLMLDNVNTAQEFADLMRALKAICDSLGISRQAPLVAIQNNINEPQEPKPFEIKINVLNKNVDKEQNLC